EHLEHDLAGGGGVDRAAVGVGGGAAAPAAVAVAAVGGVGVAEVAEDRGASAAAGLGVADHPVELLVLRLLAGLEGGEVDLQVLGPLRAVEDADRVAPEGG